MFSLKKLFTKNRKNQNLLALKLAASSQPVGALLAEDSRLGRLVRVEKDVKVLDQFIERATITGDLKWMLIAGERQVALGADDNTILRHVRNLYWAHHIDQAHRVFASLERPKTDPELFVQTELLLNLAEKHFDSTEKTLRQLHAIAPNIGLDGRVSLIRRLLEVGRYQQAKMETDRALSAHPESPGLIACDVKVSLVFDGPEAALETLHGHAKVLSLESETYRNLYGDLLLERGHFNEAFDLLKDWITQQPKAFSLYPLADMAASHADRKDEFGEILEAAREMFPSSPKLIEMQCNWFIDQNEWIAVQKHLPLMKERSEWGGKILDLVVACQKPDTANVDKAYDNLVVEGVNFPGPKIMLAFYVYYFRAANGGVDKALSLILPFLHERMADSEFLALYLRLLIAKGSDQDAQEFYATLPKGLSKTVALAPFAMYFAAQNGDHEAAKKGWQSHLKSTAHMSLNAKSSYPKEIKLRYQNKPRDVLLFLTIFNGIEFVDWFLDYYRSLGVNHFFITDNGSDDGTFEHLLQQKDVSLFQSKESFSASACGVFWSNHLMRRFGVGHWCFHVDMDEAFVFPGMENGRSLSDLLNYMDANNFGTIPSLMLDIYPENLKITDGEDPIAKSKYIDSDYFSMANELPPYQFIQGGLRSRLSGRSLLMTKAPLVKMTPDLAYIANNHQHSHLPVADISSALLHYKFIGDFIGRIDEAIARKEHFMGSRFYSALRDALREEKVEKTLLSKYSVEYKNTQQIQDMGLIKTSTAWEQFNHKG